MPSAWLKNNSCFLWRFLSLCRSFSLWQRSITYHKCHLNVLSGAPYSPTLLEDALSNKGMRSDHEKISSLQGQSLFTHQFLDLCPCEIKKRRSYCQLCWGTPALVCPPSNMSSVHGKEKINFLWQYLLQDLISPKQFQGYTFYLSTVARAHFTLQLQKYELRGPCGRY